MRLLGFALIVLVLSLVTTLASFWLIDEYVCQPSGKAYVAHGGCQ